MAAADGLAAGMIPASSITRDLVDVIILGRGPAGLAAAIECARHGLRTLILGAAAAPPTSGELQQPPRESVHPGIERLLAHLGAGAALGESTMAAYEGISSGDGSLRLGGPPEQPWTGAHISRERFDNMLLSTALAHGAVWLANSRAVDIVPDAQGSLVRTAARDELRTRYVVDATGRRCLAGRRPGFSKLVVSERLVAWSGVLRRPPKASDTDPTYARFEPRGDGWCWLAPEPSGLCTFTRLLATRHRREPDLAYEFAGAELVSRRKATDVTWRIVRPLATEGLLLVGDAAAMLDPAAGQGVLLALWSGLLAATTIRSCLADAGLAAFALADYDNELLRRFASNARRLEEAYRRMHLDLRTDLTQLPV